MKKACILTVFAFALLTASALGQDRKVNWQENLAAALKKAAEEDKTILADFTGRHN